MEFEKELPTARRKLDFDEDRENLIEMPVEPRDEIEILQEENDKSAADSSPPSLAKLVEQVEKLQEEKRQREAAAARENAAALEALKTPKNHSKPTFEEGKRKKGTAATGAKEGTGKKKNSTQVIKE